MMFGLAMNSSDVSSTSAIRSRLGMKLASAASKWICRTRCARNQDVLTAVDHVRQAVQKARDSVPGSTRSNAESAARRRIVSVVPSTEHGGTIAATREPSTSAPRGPAGGRHLHAARSGDVFDRPRGCFGQFHAHGFGDFAVLLMQIRRPPAFTMTSVIDS
jgi:hypothetical protein